MKARRLLTRQFASVSVLARLGSVRVTAGVAVTLFVLLACAARAASVSIAAATNLIYPLEALNAEFKRAHPAVTLTSSIGASGSLFAQIKSGAPFDVFLSADVEYPRQVVASGYGDGATLRTFATGRLVLWSTHAEMGGGDILSILRSAHVKKIAVAQPKTAPYGRAAQAALTKLGADADLSRKLVFGESITQTAQFVESGNADVGFVALSLVLSPRLSKKGRWVEVPSELYADVSLEHAGVLTNRGAANPTAQAYLNFLRSDAARKILRDFGYRVPDE